MPAGACRFLRSRSMASTPQRSWCRKVRASGQALFLAQPIRLSSKRTTDDRARMGASPALHSVACPPSSVPRIKRPAEELKHKKLWPGPSAPRGGWGAEESGTRSEPGPEATVGCFAGQLGACLSEIGRLYETANERVMRCVQNAAADCTNFNCRFFAQILRAELKPAGAP